VRLSIDLSLQKKADELLGNTPGAIIVMNARTGEILVMASHPAFDQNKLDEQGNILSQNMNAPFLNRATQGIYMLGNILKPLLNANFNNSPPTLLSANQFYRKLGLFQKPHIDMPAATSREASSIGDIQASPLQVVLAASTLSNNGTEPSPRIASAVNTSGQGWVVFPIQKNGPSGLPAKVANDVATSLLEKGKPYWSNFSIANAATKPISWLISGTPPGWSGTPLILVVTLEGNNKYLAEKIKTDLLGLALN
jgi:cell division protein FtsI/penicillin-binding protein 2